MPQPREYTDQEVLDGLDALRSNGGNVARTSRETGVPRSTLTSWARQAEEWATERLQAAQAGREPEPGSRVASLLRGREVADVRHQKKGEVTDGASARPMAASIHALIGTVADELESRVHAMSTEDLTRLFGVAVDKHVALTRPETDADATSPLTVIVNQMVQKNLVRPE